MRALGILCTFVLFLFLIASAPGYAQDENKPQEQTKPEDNNKAKQNDKARQDEKAKPDEKASRPDEGKRQEQQPNAGRPDERQPAANRPEERQPRDEHQGQEQRPMGNQGAMPHDQNQHQAGDRGRRIPDDQFRAHFGREHKFHVQRSQVVNVSQPVVVYGGYSWELMEPWPSDWSYDDDCYIDEVDGEYFLFDLLHPGLHIAVFIVG